MRTAGIVKNDIVDSDSGVAVSLWFQGCYRSKIKNKDGTTSYTHCKGCHNPETWDLYGGIVVENDLVVRDVLAALDDNGISRCLSILGGEPLIPENRKDCAYILEKIKEKRPETYIYLWTGYTYEELQNIALNDRDIEKILSLVNVLIDGPFIEEQKDLTLKMRGSRNQQMRTLN